MTLSKTLLLSSILTFSLGGCVSTNILPRHTDFAHQASDLKPDTNVTYGKLPNGVRYAVMHNETPSNTAALRMRFGTGSLNETDRQRGIAHFTEHMAFNGSKNIPEGEMVKRLERLGLAFGADTNAYTSFDETVYMLNLPNTSDELIDETIMIMRETASNLIFDQTAIDRERGVIKSEKRDRESPAATAGLDNLEFISRGSRLSDRLPIGIDATLESVMADDFKDYYNGHYRPDNTFVVLVGDVDTDKAIQTITKYFADWKNVGEAAPTLDAGTAPARGKDIKYYSDPEIRTSVRISTLKPFVDHADNATTRKDDFLDSLGNRILNRRLSSLAQKSDALFLSGRVNVGSQYDTAEIASLRMSSRPENWRKALAVGEQELRKALKFGFTQDELDEQIANTKKSRQVGVKSADTRSTNGLAGAILGNFSAESVFITPSTNLKNFLAYEKNIDLDDVWARFKKQWSALDAPMLYLQTSEVIENAKAEIKTAYEASLAVNVKANAAVEKGTFAYTDFGVPGKIVSQKHIEDIDVHLIKFENNVLLNFKKTEYQKGRIQISVSVGDGGLSAPSKDYGLFALAGSLMSAGGLEAHSADEIRRLTAGKAVGAGFSLQGKSFNISGSTVPSDLADQFNMLTAQLIAPGYREEAKSRFAKSVEAWYPTQDATPNGVAARHVNGLIHSGDTRFVVPSLEKYIGASISDVKNWIAPQLKDGQIEISVVGDIDKEAIIEQVARTFGALSKRKLGHKTYSHMSSVKFPKGQTKPVTLTHAGDANQALLQVYWPAPDGTNMLRNRRMAVLKSVFESRLTKVIREDEGAAYSPRASNSNSRTFKGYGYMSTSLGLVPEKIPLITKVLDDIANDFKAGEITDDEFKRAIQPTIEGLDKAFERNGYWMAVIGHAQTDSWGIDGHRTRKETYKNMKLEDLKLLAAEIFREENAYRVQILPEK